jgi:hypothetical protein
MVEPLPPQQQNTKNETSIVRVTCEVSPRHQRFCQNAGMRSLVPHMFS